MCSELLGFLCMDWLDIVWRCPSWFMMRFDVALVQLRCWWCPCWFMMLFDVVLVQLWCCLTLPLLIHDAVCRCPCSVTMLMTFLLIHDGVRRCSCSVTSTCCAWSDSMVFDAVRVQLRCWWCPRRFRSSTWWLRLSPWNRIVTYRRWVEPLQGNRYIQEVNQVHETESLFTGGQWRPWIRIVTSRSLVESMKQNRFIQGVSGVQKTKSLHWSVGVPLCENYWICQEI